MKNRIDLAPLHRPVLAACVMISLLASAPTRAHVLRQISTQFKAVCENMLASTPWTNPIARQRRRLRANPNYLQLETAAADYYSQKKHYRWSWDFERKLARLEFYQNHWSYNQTLLHAMGLLAVLTDGYLGGDFTDPEFSLRLSTLSFRVHLNQPGSVDRGVGENEPSTFLLNDCRSAFKFAKKVSTLGSKTSVTWVEIVGSEADLRALQQGIDTTLEIAYPFVWALDQQWLRLEAEKAQLRVGK